MLPEIEPAALALLEALIAAEREAKIAADALRRLAALLPPDPLLAEKIAVRLKLSNKARKRLACAAARDLDRNPASARLSRRHRLRGRPPAARRRCRRARRASAAGKCRGCRSAAAC